MNQPHKRRVVFDTNVVLGALAFPKSRLAWLRQHWRDGAGIPLICPETVRELTRVLAYEKFKLPEQFRIELLALYLPYCERIALTTKCLTACRDPKDQMFLDLAESGHADIIVTGDDDLLLLVARTRLLIETPEAYRMKSGSEVRVS